VGPVIAHVLSTVLVVLAVAALVLLRYRCRPRPWSGPSAGFRVGPLWSWCPAEEFWTPHQFDAGVRRCLSCKTTTGFEETTRG
jgi:hypothetical protein